MAAAPNNASDVATSHATCNDRVGARVRSVRSLTPALFATRWTRVRGSSSIARSIEPHESSTVDDSNRVANACRHSWQLIRWASIDDAVGWSTRSAR
jgi:hypothetical protein